MPFLDRYTEEQKTGGFLSRYTEVPALKKSVPKKSVMDYYHKRLELEEEKPGPTEFTVPEAPKWWEKEIRSARDILRFPLTLTEEIVGPMAKGLVTFPFRPKEAEAELRETGEMGVAMGKEFGKGVLDWVLASLPLTKETSVGIMAKQRIGERIKEHGYLAEAVHPGAFLGLTIKGVGKFAKSHPYAGRLAQVERLGKPEVPPTLEGRMAHLRGDLLGERLAGIEKVEIPSVERPFGLREPEIPFPGIKEKIVPSEKPIPPTVLEEVLGLKKKKAKEVPGKAELALRRELKKRGVTEKPAETSLREQLSKKESALETLEKVVPEGRRKAQTRKRLKREISQLEADLIRAEEKPAAKAVKEPINLTWGKTEPHYIKQIVRSKLGDFLREAKDVGWIELPYKHRQAVYYHKGKLVRLSEEGLGNISVLHEVVPAEHGDFFSWRQTKTAREIAPRFGAEVTEQPTVGFEQKAQWAQATGLRGMPKETKRVISQPKAVKPAKPKTAEEFLTNAEKKARERIRKRGTRLTTGVDPAEMADYAIIGAAKIGKGAIKFADWSVEMVKEFGDRIKPHLRTIYARSRQETSKFKANAELDSFIDYFEDFQAPKEFRPPRKPARVAIRERLREEGLTGKELTLETNAEFIKAVHDYGIALRKTKGGKVQPSIRVAGTYVPEDFATYTKFKDAKAGSFGGTKDPTRFAQEIDGALPGEVKAKLPGGAGPTERYVEWRTRKMLVSRIRWTKAMRSRLKLMSEGISEKQAKIANQVIAHISREGAYVDPAKLVTNPKISALTTDVNVIRFAQEGRKLYESFLRHQNEFRRLIGRKEIPHRDYYTAHSIHEATIWERAFGHDKTPKQAIGPGLPDYIKPGAPRNPRALAREVGLPETVREMDLRTLLERYIDTAAKDIYNTAIIQNNKAFIQQLESMGYEHAARGLENWTAEAFAGVKGAADRVANLSKNVHKGMRIFRFATLRSVFPFNLKWNVLVQPSSTLMGIARYGYRNSIKGLYDWTTSKKIRQEILDNAFSAIVKSQRSARMSQQDIVRGVGTAEKLNRGKLKTAADYSNFFTDWIERHLTGWSVATAKRHGASIGLKGRALWEYASDGGSKVQSLYNLEGLPGMLRSEVIKTGAMFQTFKFEAFNTLREFAGKTGMPPATHAVRVKMVLRFLAGATAINYIGQATLGRKPWELSSFLPFYGQLVSPILAAAKGEDVPMTTQRGLPVPLGIAVRGVQATREGLLKPGFAAGKELARTRDFKAAVEEFMATGKWDKLRRFTIRYLIAYAGIPGGTQMNRVVDGLIAASAGGMEDSAGRMMFPISGTKEKIRTFLGGPWSTESGQEYWDRRGKALNLDIEFMEEHPFLRDVTESIPVFGDFYKFRKDSKSQTQQNIQRMLRRGNTEGALDKRLEWNIENPDNRITLKWYGKQRREVAP